MSEERTIAEEPRTRHRLPDGTPRYANRLVHATSPYLRQHAHNPVDWFPWGDEAFAKARAEAKPIFLSIGYATCHWCHVMEEESFEDEAIAEQLRRRFVAVKVDREERPDVDGVYMAAVQALTGRGGWPMSVFLTPEGQAFFAGTYFPPRAGARGKRQGFSELLELLADAYARDPAAVAVDATKLTGAIRRALAVGATTKPAEASSVELAVRFAASRFDAAHGGVRGAPKFPSSFPVRLLLRHAARKGDPAARSMATFTLARMAEGGMNDAIGGGFHRYSTDVRWLVPHFEKMLYDNALLATAYLDAGEPAMVAVARRTLDYLARELRGDDGTFYAATDADSLVPSGAREEGYYFSFTPAVVRGILGETEARRACAWFGITDAGNFEGRSVLTTPKDPGAIAAALGEDRAALARDVPGFARALLAARSQRPPPLTDTKRIVAWNALAVSAFARAALQLGDAGYAGVARAAFERLVARLRAEGRLPHLITDGPTTEGFLDDHAFLAAAALDLFELTAMRAFLEDALRLVDLLDARFRDPESGAYFVASDDAERLLAREVPLRDGALPSGNSIAARVLLRLADLVPGGPYRARGEALLRVFGGLLPERAPALEHALIAVMHAHATPATLVVVVDEPGSALAASARPFVDAGCARLEPPVAVLVGTEAELAALAPWVPDAAGKTMREGRATAYLCSGGTCLEPTTDPAIVRAALAEG